MKTRNYIYWPAAVFMVVISGLLTPAFSQESAQSRYEVSDEKGNVTTVATSANKDAVVVSLHRQGQPTHHYRAYPQAATITVQVERQTAFTYYINLGRIEVKAFRVGQGAPADASFTVELSKVSGTERRQRKDIAAVSQRFKADMRVLRAVRAYDDSADVQLAELSYVVLTYDDSIMDGKASPSLAVREAAPEAAGERVSAKLSVKAVARAGRPQDTLPSCLSICEGHYSECQADPSVRDKTVCHTNRTSCANTCYGVYGGKEKPPKQPIQP